MTKRFTRSLHSKTDTWCTGEDSNLRSSQGAADLQSAAINHSATCAEMPILRTLHSSGNFRRGLSTRAENTCRLNKDRKSPEYACARKPLHVGKIPNGVRWKICYAAATPVPLTPLHFRNCYLELAKGFEPPTPSLQIRCSTS